MPKTKDQKNIIIEEISQKLEKSKSIVFATFSKLGVKDSEILRKEMRQSGGEYYVAKKTLLGIAMNKMKLDGANLKGCKQNISTIFGYDDEVAPAKIADKFQKSHPGTIEFYGGFLNGRFISGQEVGELAGIPSKPELLAKLVGSINSPVSGFVNALAGNLRNFVSVLQAISDKK